MTPPQTIARGLLGAFFIVAGVYHFVKPAMYLSIMPPILPYPLALIAISGAAEIAGGLGVIIPCLRTAAAWGLIALLMAVYPANIYATFHGMSFGHGPVPAWILWLRLPLQFAFIAWVWWTCLARSSRPA